MTTRMFKAYTKVSTPYFYYQNGIDVTYYIMNNIKPPMSERFFEVTCR